MPARFSVFAKRVFKNSYVIIMGGPYKPTRFTEPYPMLTKTFFMFQKYYYYFRYWYALYMEVGLSKYIKLKLNYEYV